ncbi:glutamate racemase [Boudabousia marimammalium]|uniref:Glutamate racemase n=2 Tax=Boudabousia marimammalium TaxID=156892 RepID=A0A1Q5PMC8_9ACTO|nr:glutamate racemase [Boudabousia marimammalium]
MNNAPIGIFDSGVGGLTVARSILEQLPHEEILYVGDTAHVPYGTKSISEVRGYALDIMDKLVERGVKALVIACNTASSAVLEEARNLYSIPVFEVVEPAARNAAALSPSGRIGVLATPATIRSGSYNKVLSRFPNVQVFSQACPALVDMVEAGQTSGPEVIAQVSEYVKPLQDAEVDTVILGCTHYPLLKGAISYVMGPGVNLVSSSDASTESVYRYITDSGEGRDPQMPEPKHEFMITDASENFTEMAKRFIGPAVRSVTVIGDQSAHTKPHGTEGKPS